MKSDVSGQLLTKSRSRYPQRPPKSTIRSLFLPTEFPHGKHSLSSHADILIYIYGSLIKVPIDDLCPVIGQRLDL